MNIVIAETAEQAGRRAARDGADRIRRIIDSQGEARVIFATGASQLDMLAALVASEGIDWSKVTGFHLDEYISLPTEHPASFRGYLKKRLADLVPFRTFHYVNGEGDPSAECRRLGELIRSRPVDLACVGIGENGHLAFNDPPADFETDQPFIVVELDEACRRQQLGEGWFARLDDVPRRAISMSIRQIMKSAAVVCTVPDLRKARAVRDALEGPVTPRVPASILQNHPAATIYLDRQSSSLLSSKGGTRP